MLKTLFRRNLPLTLRTNFVRSKQPFIRLLTTQAEIRDFKQTTKTLPTTAELSYVKGSTVQPLLSETLTDIFDKAVQNSPSKLAIVSHYENQQLSYKEVSSLVNHLSASLLKLNIKPGQKIGLFLPNCVPWYLFQLVSLKLNTVLVTLNPAYKSLELKQAISHIGIDVLVFMPQFKSLNYDSIVQGIDGLKDELKVKHLVVVDTVHPENSQYNKTVNEGCLSFKTLISEPYDHQNLQTKLNSLKELRSNQDIVNIQFTSGTTGIAKGVCLTHHNLVNNANQVAKNQNFTSNTRLCLPVPLYHCFGQVMGNLAILVNQATLIYPNPIFDSKMTLEACQKYKADALYGVPTMFIELLDNPNFKQFKLDNLRTGIMAGTSCPPPLMEKVIQKLNLTEMTICYGMTETSPVTFQSNYKDSFQVKVNSVGKVVDHVEAKVVEPDQPFHTAATLLRNKQGRLLTKGYVVMKGYYNDPIKTQQSISEEGWMDTGDLATLNNEGLCKIVGRVKDLIIRGGENIYPTELEALLHTYPRLSDNSIIGVPDQKFGEQICLCYIPKTNEDVTEEDLYKFCKENLSHFKVPKYYLKLDKFPLTVSGKVMKFKLKELAIQRLGL